GDEDCRHGSILMNRDRQIVRVSGGKPSGRLGSTRERRFDRTSRWRAAACGLDAGLSYDETGPIDVTESLFSNAYDSAPDSLPEAPCSWTSPGRIQSPEPTASSSSTPSSVTPPRVVCACARAAPSTRCAAWPRA